MTKITPEAVKAALEEHDACWGDGGVWIGGSAETTPLEHIAPDLATAYLAQAEEIERLRERVEAADRLASWAKALSERKASPATGGRLILERDVVGLETALAAYRATEERG